MRVTFGTICYAATRDGVVYARAEIPNTSRGVITDWNLSPLGDDGKVLVRKTIQVKRSLLFDNYDEANKAVFKLRLKEEG